jgi:alpha-beta hydrolase superfamily lysophospholipase
MALDTSSFNAYVRSLELTSPVNTRPGRLIPGPPAEVVEVGLWLGLGSMMLDTPRLRSLLNGLGLSPGLFRAVGQKLRTRAEWASVLQEMAAPHIADAEACVARGERETALQKIKAALTILYIAINGDGYYFYTPMSERWSLLPRTQRLYRMLRHMLGARTERLPFKSTYGRTNGLLQLPPQARGARPHSLPALVAFHPLGSDKDSYDTFLGHFRAAGYATFCVDLPGHGENYDGPRLKPDAECVGVAALDVLAKHPAIDPERLGVMGGSMGGFFAQRTAAASPRVKACLAYGSPFDMSYRMDQHLPGVVDCFAWVVGANSLNEAAEAVKDYHLRDVLEKIECPVCLVHGTQDHLCDFTATYEIASRLKAPLTVRPLVGVDHEAVCPATEELAAPGIEWLRDNL